MEPTEGTPNFAVIPLHVQNALEIINCLKEKNVRSEIRRQVVGNLDKWLIPKKEYQSAENNPADRLTKRNRDARVVGTFRTFG